MSLLKGYLKADFIRSMGSYTFIVGIIGVFASYCFSIYQMLEVENSVLYVFVASTHFIPFIFAITFAALPFAGVFCEEMDNEFVRLEIVRGELKHYVISKFLVISITSIITMLLGSFLFIIYLRCQLPWVDMESVTYQTALENGAFAELLRQEKYILYFFLYCFKIGLLSSNISVLAGCLSLFWNSKFFVFSIPFLFYYLQVYYVETMFPGVPQLKLMSVYNSYYNVWNDEKLSSLWAVIIYAAFLVIFGMIGFKQLKRSIFK